MDIQELITKGKFRAVGQMQATVGNAPKTLPYKSLFLEYRDDGQWCLVATEEAVKVLRTLPLDVEAKLRLRISSLTTTLDIPLDVLIDEGQCTGAVPPSMAMSFGSLNRQTFLVTGFDNGTPKYVIKTNVAAVSADEGGGGYKGKPKEVEPSANDNIQTVRERVKARSQSCIAIRRGSDASLMLTVDVEGDKPVIVIPKRYPHSYQTSKEFHRQLPSIACDVLLHIADDPSLLQKEDFETFYGYFSLPDIGSLFADKGYAGTKADIEEAVKNTFNLSKPFRQIIDEAFADIEKEGAN